MGELVDRVGIRMLVHGDGLADNFKNNSLYFYDKYQKSDKDVSSISIKDIKPGGFYHLHYLDSSNWMMYSPIFVTNFKKIGKYTIIFGVNFNFKVDYNGMYSELIKYGFEYAIVEYNAQQIKLVHKIHMESIPRFLISGHPKNKYDPGKLFDIWKAKIADKDKRNQEIMKATMDDFYDARGEINEKYVLLKGHIQRIQNNMKKYGGR